MKKKIIGCSGILGIILPLIILSIVAIPFFNNFKSTNKPEIISLTVLDDGKSAFGISKTLLESNSIDLLEVDLETGKDVTSNTIPSSFFRSAYLYGQGQQAVIIVPGDVNGDEMYPYDIYRVVSNQAPELLSTLYLDTPFTVPMNFNNTIILTGVNEAKENVVCFISNGEAININLDQIPEFSGNIKNVSYVGDTYLVPMLQVDLFNNQTYYAGLFLSEDKTLAFASGNIESGGSSRDDLTLQFTRAYFGEYPMIQAVAADDGGLYNLATFNPADSDAIWNSAFRIEGGKLTVLDGYSLYNPSINVFSQYQIMISGTSDPNPDKGSLQVYVYDRKANRMEPLSEAAVSKLNPVYFSSNAKIRLNADVLILEAGEGVAAVTINLKSNKVDYVVPSTFLDTPNSNSLMTDLVDFVRLGGGGVIVFIFFSWIGVYLLILLGALISSSKRKKTLKRGVVLLATVTQTTYTGVQINSLPQIKLSLSFSYEGQPVSAEVKHLVSPGQAIAPGMQVAISYDPVKRKAILVDGQAGNDVDLQEAYTQTMVQQGVTTEHALDIAKTGIKAKGVLMSIAPTGKIVGDNSEMELTVKVTREDGSSYDTTVLKIVPSAALSKLQPGLVLTVYYKDEDEKDITLSYSI